MAPQECRVLRYVTYTSFTTLNRATMSSTPNKLFSTIYPSSVSEYSSGTSPSGETASSDALSGDGDASWTGPWFDTYMQDLEKLCQTEYQKTRAMQQNHKQQLAELDEMDLQIEAADRLMKECALLTRQGRHAPAGTLA